MQTHHTRTTSYSPHRAHLFFLEWVSAWIKDIKAAAQASLLLCCGGAPPPTWLLLRRAPIELAWKRPKWEPWWKRGIEWPSLHQTPCTSCRIDMLIPPETIVKEAPKVPLIIIIFFCPNSRHFRDVLCSHKVSTSNTSLSHTPGFALVVVRVFVWGTFLKVASGRFDDFAHYAPLKKKKAVLRWLCINTISMQAHEGL